jgi:lysophospholipase L1-like esterase
VEALEPIERQSAGGPDANEVSTELTAAREWRAAILWNPQTRHWPAVSDSQTPSLRTGLLVSAVASVLLLLMAEGILRFWDLAPSVELIQIGRFRLAADPRIGYEPVPSLPEGGEDSSFHSYRFYAYRGFGNSLGYRDTEHSIEKEEGSYRIVVLGDSIAAGLHVLSYEDTFPWLLQAYLREADVEADVINFGVSGYNTDQEIATLRARGVDFDPDLVLLAYCLNDHQRVSSGILRVLRETQRERGVVNRLAAPPWATRSALYRFLRYGLPNWFAAQREEQPDARRLTAEELDAPFRELADLARVNDFRVLVAVFPRFQHLSEYAWDAEHQLLAEASRQHGFLHLDLLPGYRDCAFASTLQLSSDEWHPSAYGHRCAARAMADFIADGGSYPLSLLEGRRRRLRRDGAAGDASRDDSDHEHQNRE